MRPALAIPMLLLLCAAPANVRAQDGIEHHYAENDGVRIHYVAMGEGPLVLFIHGFPDFWYGWRHQMEGLEDRYRVVAMDSRGYNRSDQPEGRDAYGLGVLMRDVAAVITAEGARRATIVGHDLGGLVAWYFAMGVPQMTEALIVVNMPHPRAFMRELANDPRQQARSLFARNFQLPDSHEKLTSSALAGMVTSDPAERARYVEAFERSSFDAMMNYYRENFPRPPYRVPADEVEPLAMPVLQFHGLRDEYLLPGTLAGTWDWVDDDYTLVTIPDAGHWAHHDAADLVTATMRDWLDRH